MRCYIDVYVRVWVANCGREVGGGDCVAASGLEKNESKRVSYDEYDEVLWVDEVSWMMLSPQIMLVKLSIALSWVVWPLRQKTWSKPMGKEGVRSWHVEHQ